MEHLYRVVKKTIEWDITKPFKLGLFGDVHYDSASCDRDRFNKFLALAKQEELHLFGMGDYHDFASCKEQKALMAAGLHDQTYDSFDGIVEERNRAFTEKLKGLNLLGLIGGNHTWKLKNGYYADEDLSQRLKTEYLGWLCVFALQLNFGNCRGVTLYFVLCHGLGGGKLPGTSINKIDDLKRIFPFSDVYAMGHDHQRGCWPTSTLWPINSGTDFRIKEKRQYLVRTGSFMKSYQEQKSQYTTAGLMRPADLGAVRLNFSFERQNKPSQIIVHTESIV